MNLLYSVIIPSLEIDNDKKIKSLGLKYNDNPYYKIIAITIRFSLLL
jgi:hypothetical protein